MSVAVASRQRNDEALDILRRLEPMLVGMQSQINGMQSQINDMQVQIRDVQTEQRRMGERLATLEGKVSQLPTLQQTIATMLGVNAGVAALGFSLAGLLVKFMT